MNDSKTGGSDSKQSAAERSDRNSERRASAARPWAFGALAFVLIVFVAQNSRSVQVDFILAKTDTPLFFALLVAASIGALLGWLGPKLRRAGRRR